MCILGGIRRASAVVALAIASTLSLVHAVIAAEPIKIGFSMALTGGVAPAGKQVLAALQIWRDDVNAKGGLLGRPVELVFYDDQSNPANVPGIYTKLIDVDKVDLLIGPYATNMVAPAIPVLMQSKKTTIGILANAVLTKYRAVAKDQGIDLMGWAYPPLGYAAAQVLAQAVDGSKSLDHKVLGKDGEWTESRMVFTQFQGVTGNSLDQYKDTTHEVVVWPTEYKSGNMIYPYAKAKQ